MAKARLKLRKAIDFQASIFDGTEPIISLQWWYSATTETEVYVRLHNGVEITRQVCTTESERAEVAGTFARAERDFTIMSPDAAGDEIARRGGPAPRWCSARDCGTQIPYAAAHCAEGHAVDHVNAGTYSHGVSRRPAIVVLTGGKK